jgi:flagellar basal-body rod protein FlgC
MNLFGVLEMGGAGMSAERLRAEVVTSNLANVETTRTPEGGPYRRRMVRFRAEVPHASPFQLAFERSTGGRSVRVDAIVTDQAPPERRYQPGHPDADGQGYVAYPAIQPVAEMADLLGAVRAYEANAASVQAAKQMIQQAIEILR